MTGEALAEVLTGTDWTLQREPEVLVTGLVKKAVTFVRSAVHTECSTGINTREFRSSAPRGQNERSCAARTANGERQASWLWTSLGGVKIRCRPIRQTCSAGPGQGTLAQEVANEAVGRLTLMILLNISSLQMSISKGCLPLVWMADDQTTV